MNIILNMALVALTIQKSSKMKVHKKSLPLVSAGIYTISFFRHGILEEKVFKRAAKSS